MMNMANGVNGSMNVSRMGVVQTIYPSVTEAVDAAKVRISEHHAQESNENRALRERLDQASQSAAYRNIHFLEGVGGMSDDEVLHGSPETLNQLQRMLAARRGDKFRLMFPGSELEQLADAVAPVPELWRTRWVDYLPAYIYQLIADLEARLKRIIFQQDWARFRAQNPFRYLCWMGIREVMFA